MTFKRLSSPSAGDSTHFGGLDVNKFSDYLGGTDISGTETIDINTLTAFRNGKFTLRNPANTFSYTFVPSAIAAARNVTWPLLTGNDQVTMDAHATTITNKTLSKYSNTVTNDRHRSIYTITIDGTTVKARNNLTGVVDFTADNTVNAVTAINSAINNIKNITGATLDTARWGASITLGAGVYKCTTNLLVSGESADADREGIIIEGEGMGTILNYTPASALTYAVTLNGSHIVFRNLLLRINANVSNGIFINGMIGALTDANATMGIVDNIRIEGPNVDGSWIPAANIGILHQSDPGVRRPYWWRIERCAFMNMDIGIWQSGVSDATTLFINKCVFLLNTIGMYIEGGQNFITDNYVQGNGSYGQYGLRLTGNASFNHISNLMAEMFWAGVPCAALKIDSGANNNQIFGVQNFAADNVLWHVVKNDSGNLNNVIYYHDSSSTYHHIDAKIANVPQNPIVKRFGAYLPSAGNTLSTAGSAIGALSGVLTNHVPTGTGTASNTYDTTEGVLMSMISGATAGSNAGLVSPTFGVGVGRRLFGLRAQARFSVTATANGRFYFGFTSATAIPASATPLANADHGLIVGWTETGSGSTFWSIFHNDGSGPATVENVTGPGNKDTGFHTIEIRWAAASNPVVIFDGVGQAITTDLPATTANLFFNLVAQASTTTAKTLLLKGIWIDVDK